MTNTIPLAPGLRREDTYTVQNEHTAEHLGSGDLRVLATPSMILFMEMTARKLLAKYLPPGISSVGARVDVRHLAPSPVGAAIRTVAEIIEVNGNKIKFSIEAWDGHVQIGDGTHLRVVVEEARFMEMTRLHWGKSRKLIPPKVVAP